LGKKKTIIIISDRLRQLQEEKIFARRYREAYGLLRCYISSVENGHTVPTDETLEKIARALEVPPYQL